MIRLSAVSNVNYICSLQSVRIRQPGAALRCLKNASIETEPLILHLAEAVFLERDRPHPQSPKGTVPSESIALLIIVIGHPKHFLCLIDDGLDHFFARCV